MKSMMRVTSLKASSTSSRNKFLQDQANSVITSSRALPIDPHASPLPSSRRQTYVHSILIYPRLSTTSRASRVFHIYREADVEFNSEWLPAWFSYRCFTVEKLIRLSERVILFTRTDWKEEAKVDYGMEGVEIRRSEEKQALWREVDPRGGVRSPRGLPARFSNCLCHPLLLSAGCRLISTRFRSVTV